MLKFSAPPLNEQSIALQFGSPIPITPTTATDYFNKHRRRYPNLELKQPVGILGVPTLPGIFQLTDELVARFWLSSKDEYELVQLQNNMIALNWRKRNLPGVAPEVAYPGFEAMITSFEDLASDVFKELDVKEPPTIATASLYYDNLWPQEEMAAKDMFKFWSPIGVAAFNGPQTVFSVVIVDDVLGPHARIDVQAAVGGVIVSPETEGKPHKVAKLLFNCFANPPSSTAVDARKILTAMHAHVEDLFTKIVADGLMEKWK